MNASLPDLALFDSAEALALCNRIAPQGRLATDNPLLVLAAPSSRTLDMDRLLTLEDADRLGTAALALVEDIDHVLDCAPIAEAYGLVHGHIRISGGSSRLASSLLYRGAALARSLALCAPARVSIAAIDRSPPSGVATLAMERFQSPWPRLARLGFFGSATVEVHPVDPPLPETINETSSQSQFRRLALLPALSLGYLTARSLRMLGRRKRAVVVAGENELIRETLPWLLLRGYDLIHSDLVEAGKGVAARPFDPTLPVPPLLRQVLEPLLLRHLASTGEFTPCQSAAVAHLLMWHIDGGLQRLGHRLPIMRRRLNEVAGRVSGKPVMLVNGLFGGDGAQLYGLCRELGVEVMDFEHGVTTGLSSHSERKLRFCEATACDAMFVSNETARRSFLKVNRSAELAVHAVGLAQHTRTMLRPWLQRFLARRDLGVKAGQPTVMHVSTTPFTANQRGGPHQYTEAGVVDLNCRLIGEVYAPLSGWTVLFKDYPTQRFPFEPRTAEYAGTAAHMRFLGDEDLRYVRAAADVIVTMVPTSTLGWCVGTGVPLIWLDSPYTPLLTEDAARAFQEGFLWVDMRDPEWPSKLTDLLAQGTAALTRIWRDKAAARQRLLEGYVVGPAGSPGRRAAKQIARRAAAR